MIYWLRVKKGRDWFFSLFLEDRFLIIISYKELGFELDIFRILIFYDKNKKKKISVYKDF